MYILILLTYLYMWSIIHYHYKKVQYIKKILQIHLKKCLGRDLLLDSTVE